MRQVNEATVYLKTGKILLIHYWNNVTGTDVVSFNTDTNLMLEIPIKNIDYSFYNGIVELDEEECFGCEEIDEDEEQEDETKTRLASVGD